MSFLTTPPLCKECFSCCLCIQSLSFQNTKKNGSLLWSPFEWVLVLDVSSSSLFLPSSLWWWSWFSSMKSYYSCHLKECCCRGSLTEGFKLSLITCISSCLRPFSLSFPVFDDHPFTPSTLHSKLLEEMREEGRSNDPKKGSKREKNDITKIV